MSDSARWHKFDMEKLGNFIADNLVALKFDVSMDPETLKDIIAAAGWRVEMDRFGWHIVKHSPKCKVDQTCDRDCPRLVHATLPYRECLNDKAKAHEYPMAQEVNPGRRKVWSMFRPK